MSSVATEAPLEKSTIEWAEAKRIRLTGPGVAERSFGLSTAGVALRRMEPRHRFLESSDGMDTALTPWLDSGMPDARQCDAAQQQESRSGRLGAVSKCRDVAARGKTRK